MKNNVHRFGFTLIEISVVLVIIGLIIGGVLVGRDLVESAAVKSQIAQVQQYNAAVNNFKTKYGYMPGDMPEPVRTQYNMTFSPTGNAIAKCIAPNGDGIINTIYNFGPLSSAQFESQYCGEYTLFWADLARTGFIEGNFPNTNTYIANGSYTVVVTGANINRYVPKAILGEGYNVYVFSGGLSSNITNFWLSGISASNQDRKNYFALARFTSFNEYLLGTSTRSISVNTAYTIDKKIDDGLPALGNVKAGAPAFGGSSTGVFYSASASTGSSTTCFHGTTQENVVYSVTAAGSTRNCILSFLMQ